MAARKGKYWNVVLTMVQVISRELRKVRLQAETEHGSDNLLGMVVHYLWVTLQAHRAVDDFLLTKICQHPEVALNITLYLFEHGNT